MNPLRWQRFGRVLAQAFFPCLLLWALLALLLGHTLQSAGLAAFGLAVAAVALLWGHKARSRASRSVAYEDYRMRGGAPNTWLATPEQLKDYELCETLWRMREVSEPERETR